MPKYIIEYSQHARASCKECQLKITKGQLKIGNEVNTMYGNGKGMHYRHFGCLNKQNCNNFLGGNNVANKVSGFHSLTAEDQERVRYAAIHKQVPAQSLSPAQQPKAPIPQYLAVSSPTKAGPSSPAKPSRTTKKRYYEDDDDYTQAHVGNVGQAQADVFYVRFSSEVIKVQHHPGFVNAGETVSLKRDYNSPYDRNMIFVCNARGEQVGHLPKATNANLAPLVDKRAISLQGTMVTGRKSANSMTLKIMVDIYGPIANRNALAPYLSWAGELSHSGVPPATPEAAVSTQVVGTSSSPTKKARKASVPVQYETESERNARIVMEGLKSLEQKDSTSNRVMEMFTKSFDPWTLPLHPNPPSIANQHLLHDLMPHQSQALSWMLEREYPRMPECGSGKTLQMWQYLPQPLPHWYNIASKASRPWNDPPSITGRGGILADAMGLGKTMVMLSLILATLQDVPQGWSKTTLIVCPLSVVSNWETQIAEHIAYTCRFKFMIFHGDGKRATQAELESCDAVITTYDVLSAEFLAREKSPSKRGTGTQLLNIYWKRVVLDEGHKIRSSTAAWSKACHSFVAYNRWVLSGTPIVNSAKDLSSQLQFLKICAPLDNPNEFTRCLYRPLMGGDSHGVNVLQALITDNCLRRTKEMQDAAGNRLVELPPVKFYILPVELHKQDRKDYDTALKASKRVFQEYVARNRTGTMPPNVLALLTRLRQLALLSALLPEGYVQNIRPEAEHQNAVIRLTEQKQQELAQRLKAAIADSEECPICIDTLDQPRITLCGHTFCLDCITDVIVNQQKCPMDRTNLPTIDYIFDLPAVSEDDDEDEYPTHDDGEPLPTSAKIETLLRYLKAFNDGQKSLVFSQFTSFLSYIEPHLIRAGIPVVRFDGSMSEKKRAKIIAEFQKPVPPQQIAAGFQSSSKGKGRQTVPVVMLISLQAGSLGLNLTAASNVFLMDPWWQSAVEMQAIDRVNRIGQTANEVRVFQMIATNTIEEKVLKIQERKNRMISQAFSGHDIKESANEKKIARWQDMQELFGIAAAPATPPMRQAAWQ